MSLLTGNDIAAIAEAATRHGVRWKTERELPAPYIIDHHARTIWLNGRLTVGLYFEALWQACDEISEFADNVVPLRRPGAAG